MRSVSFARRALPCLAVAILSACGGATSTATGGAAAAATTAPTVSVAATSTVATAATTAPTAAATVASTTAAGATPSPAAATGAATSASGAAVSFKTDIQPIFTTSCTPCHITTATKGLSLADYAGVMKGGQDGVVVKAGDANGRLLVQKIKGTQTIGVRMPYNKTPLPDATIQKISDWVAQGAQDN